jgi:hypothetical protein
MVDATQKVVDRGGISDNLHRRVIFDRSIVLRHDQCMEANEATSGQKSVSQPPRKTYLLLRTDRRRVVETAHRVVGCHLTTYHATKCLRAGFIQDNGVEETDLHPQEK